MRRPIGFFWHAQQSQIYPELTRLEGKGYIVAEVIEQYNRPDKKVYTITEQGRTVLREWVTQVPLPVPERSELLLKTYAIWLADPKKAIKMFHAQEDEHLTRLAQYEQIKAELEREYGSMPPLDSPFFGDYATLQRGISYEREYANWCRWMIEQLERYLG